MSDDEDPLTPARGCLNAVRLSCIAALVIAMIVFWDPMLAWLGWP